MKPTLAGRTLASLALCMLLSSLGTSIANVALPTLAEAFHTSFQGVQWVVLAYLLALTTLIVGAGRLGDLIGRRRLLLAGLFLFTIASGLCGLAPTLGLLIAARALQGLGAALLMALSLALIGETVPPEKTGRALGLLGTMSALGTALGPSLGGLLIAGLGWRSLFLINLPLGLLTWVLAQRSLPVDLPPTAHTRFEPVATLLFRDRRLSLSLFLSLLVATVLMATLVAGPFYLSRTLGLDPARVGLVLSAGPLAAALAGIPAGRLVDRFGAPRATLAGLFVLAAGGLALSLLPATLGLPGYLVPLVVLTTGYALFQTANNTAVLAGTPADRRGVLSGLLNLSRHLGLIAGTAGMGAVFAASGLRTTFAVATGLLVVAIALVFWRSGGGSARLKTVQLALNRFH
jgi:MFS family permease